MSKDTVALAVVDKETLQVVKRVEVAGRGENYIFEVYRGLSRKLNRKQYFVQEVKQQPMEQTQK